MYFHSLQFLFFLVLALALYWLKVDSKRWRIGVLLVASLAFYAVWTLLSNAVTCFCRFPSPKLFYII